MVYPYVRARIRGCWGISPLVESMQTLGHFFEPLYMEGITPSRDWPEGMNTLEERVNLLDLQMVLATVTKFLNEIHHQWLYYGPKGPNGQPGNARQQQATAINQMLEALDINDVRSYPSRASSPGEAPTIKVKGQPSQGVPITPKRKDNKVVVRNEDSYPKLG